MRKRRADGLGFERPSASVLSVLLRERPLTERQRQVLRLRSEGLSCGTVAKQLKISSERVRQIEARLRTMARSLR